MTAPASSSCNPKQAQLCVQVKGLSWPAKQGPHTTLLGPVNNLGKFRWYYGFFSRMDRCFDLRCVKVNHLLEAIAIGRLDNLSIDLLDSQKQKSLIAKCIRKAEPLTTDSIMED